MLCVLLHLWLRSVFAATRLFDEIVATPDAHRIGPPGCAICSSSIDKAQMQMSHICPVWKQAESVRLPG